VTKTNNVYRWALEGREKTRVGRGRTGGAAIGQMGVQECTTGFARGAKSGPTACSNKTRKRRGATRGGRAVDQDRYQATVLGLGLGLGMGGPSAEKSASLWLEDAALGDEETRGRALAQHVFADEPGTKLTLLHLAIVVRLQLQLLGFPFFSDLLFLRVLASASQALQR
jgi:hypothetical protein